MSCPARRFANNGSGYVKSADPALAASVTDSLAQLVKARTQQDTKLFGPLLPTQLNTDTEEKKNPAHIVK
jgi:hypothetical protein